MLRTITAYSRFSLRYNRSISLNSVVVSLVVHKLPAKFEAEAALPLDLTLPHTELTL